MELGTKGASLRVLWVTLTDNKEQRVKPKSQEFVIPQEVMLGPGKQVSSLNASSGLETQWGGQGSGAQS